MINRIKALLAEWETLGDGSTVVLKDRTNRVKREEYAYRHSHGPLSWEEGGDRYTAHYDVQCTTSGVYAHLYCRKNDNPVSVREIKDSVKRMEVE